MHDWLATKHFLGKLSAVVRVFRGDIDRPDLTSGEVVKLVEEWRGRRLDVLWLIENFDVCMSPAVYLEGDGFADCGPDSALIAVIIHELWMIRTGTEALKKGARKAVDAVNSAAARVERVMAGRSAFTQLDLSAEDVEAMDHFYQSLRHLHGCLAAYPVRMRVT